MAYTGGMFATDTDAWLPGDLHHTLRAQITDQTQTFTYDLDVIPESGSITLDETAVPYVQATLVIAVPSATVLSALDPRTRNLVFLWPGYRRPDGTAREAAWPWTLYVREREVDRLAGTVTLTLASVEALVQDWQWTNAATSQTITSGTACGAGIGSLLLLAVPNFNAVYYTSTATAGTALVVNTDAPSIWTAVQELADRAECQVWPTIGPTLGRDFEMRASPITPDAGKATTLTTGPAGFVTSWTTSTDRDADWANCVMIVYTAGGTGPVRAAEVSAGTGGSATAGKKVYVERRNTTAPAAGDNRAPASMVNRMIRRGVQDIVIGKSAYWLEPRWSVYLPDGTLRIVQRVQHEFATGLMTVTTRSA